MNPAPWEKDTAYFSRPSEPCQRAAELREKYGIKPGDIFRLVDLYGVFILTAMAPLVPERAREIERLRKELGLSTEDLLAPLREQREVYYSYT